MAEGQLRASDLGLGAGQRCRPWVDKSAWFDEIGYEPYEQQRNFHDSEARFRTYLAGKRTGKSYCASRDVEPLILTPGTNGWLVGVHYDRAEREFAYLWDDLVRGRFGGHRLGMVEKHYNVRGGHMLFRTAWGSTARVKSARDEDSLEAEPLDWAILCEPCQHKFSTYELIRERVAERRGIILLPGSAPPNNAHWITDLILRGENPEEPDFAAWRVRASECPYPGADELAKLRTQISDLRYRRDFECELIPSEEMVYPGFSELSHVESLRYDSALPLYLCMDFGFSNPWVCLWVQVDRDDRVLVLREYYHRRRTNQVNTSKILEFHEARGFGEITNCYPDPSGASEIAELKAQGLPVSTAGGRDVKRGIGIVRDKIERADGGLPGLVVDPTCVHTIDELQTYHNTPGTDEPAKEDDHCPDALRYLHLNLFRRGDMEISWV